MATLEAIAAQTEALFWVEVWSFKNVVVLDLLDYESVQDSLTDVIAVPLNWIFQLSRNRHIKPTPEAIEAAREHARTDKYLTRSQAQQIYTRSLTGAKIRKHLFWRYSVVWEKSKA